MMPIYTKLNLEQYIAKVERQKEVLELSTCITSNCKRQLSNTYDLQIEIAKTELDFINSKSIEVIDVTTL